MKIGIVGAAGFVGQRLTEWLALTGEAEPVPIVRSHSAATRLAHLGVPCRFADALDEAALAVAFEGCDVIVHAIVGDEATIERSPAIAVAAARRAGVRRIVYLSSGMVYGYSPQPGDDDETAPRTGQPRGYNRSKAVAETRLHQARKDGSDVVILRPTIVVGPRSAAFSAWPAVKLLSGTAFLVDGGRGICNAVHVDNLVQAIWLSAITPAARTQTFAVSDRETVTWADLYRSISEAIGVPFENVQQVCSADFGPGFGAGESGMLRALAKTRPMVRIRKNLSPRVKGTLKSVRSGWRTDYSARYAQSSGVDIDESLFALQRCEYQFPIAKAERILGYDPIPFEEGARRTGEWLRATGFAAR